MKYFDTLSLAMKKLSQNKKTIFLGQAVEYPGTAMFNTLTKVDKKKLVELPVAEEMQMGLTIGYALNGDIPISIYPRYNFLLLAINQLVNHLDKIEKISNNEYKTKVIIRTSIGSRYPLNPQHQHLGDFTASLRKMCTNIEFIKLDTVSKILPSYEKALSRKDGKSTVLIEYGDYYNSK